MRSYDEMPWSPWSPAGSSSLPAHEHSSSTKLQVKIHVELLCSTRTFPLHQSETTATHSETLAWSIWEFFDLLPRAEIESRNCDSSCKQLQAAYLLARKAKDLTPLSAESAFFAAFPGSSETHIPSSALMTRYWDLFFFRGVGSWGGGLTSS